MLDIIAGGLLGGVVATGCAIIPGLSSQQAVIGAAAVASLFGPMAAAAATVTSLAVSNFLNTTKETLTPQASGNIEVAATAPPEAEMIDAQQVTTSALAAKTVGTFMGLAGGAWLGGTIASFSTFPITGIVMGLIVILLLGTFQRHWLVTLLYLFGSQLFFRLAGTLGIVNPVLVLGSILFLIPGCLRAMRPRPQTVDGQDPRLQFEGIAKRMIPFDLIKSTLGAMISVITPGINESLLVTATTRKTNVITQLTAQAAGAMMESYSLVGLLAGVASAKSVLGLELGVSGVGLLGLWVVPLFGGAILASMLLHAWVYSTYKSIGLAPGAHLLGLIIGVASVIAMTGPVVGPVLVAGGLLIDVIFCKLGVPGAIRSLLFAGPILFG